MPDVPQPPDPASASFLFELRQIRSLLTHYVEANRGVESASGVPFAAPVGQRARRPEDLWVPEDRRPAPEESGSSSQRTRENLGRLYSASEWFIRNVGERGTPQNSNIQENQSFGGGSADTQWVDSASRGATGGVGGGGRPPAQGTPQQPDWQTALRPRAESPMTIPRYGEFNAQDILGLGSQALAKLTLDDSGQRRSTTGLNTTMGSVGGLLDAGSDVAPYFAAAKQILNNKFDLQVGAKAMSSENLSMGFKRGGLPLSIGGYGLNMQGLGPIPFGDAGQEQFRENIDAIKMGAHAGISIKEYREIQRALKQQGYTGDDLSRMGKVLGDIKRDRNIGDIGSAESTAPLVDQMMRYGTTSLDQLRDTLKGLGETALNARMPVDELKNSLNEFANDQQQKGATYAQGLRLGKEFSSATGLDPRLLGKLQDNGTVQGMFMSQTGLLPQMMGISPLGTQMDSIYKSMDLLGGAFGGMTDRTMKTPYGEMTVSGTQQRDALVAQQLGMSPEELAKFKRDRKTNEAEGYLTQMSDRYGDLSRGIHDSRATKADKADQFAKLYKGEAGTPGLAQMKKAMKDAGFSEEQIKSVDKAAPWARSDKIRKIMEDKDATRNRTDQNNQTVTIEASPELRRWLKIHAPTSKVAVNDGLQRANATFNSSDPYAVELARRGMG